MEAQSKTPLLTPEQVRGIIGKVAAEHKVLIDPGDPAFFFASICAEVCAAGLEKAGERLDATAANLEKARTAALEAAGGQLQTQVNGGITALRALQDQSLVEFSKAVQKAVVNASKDATKLAGGGKLSGMSEQMLMVLLAIVGLFGIGFGVFLGRI